MKNRLIYRLLLILFCFGYFVNKTNSQDIQNHDYNNIQVELISNYLLQFPDNSQLSIALVNKNNVSFLGARKDSVNINLIENKDSIFEIGSITKVFTSTILCRLAIDSVIDLDGSIDGIFQDKLKQVTKDSIKITFKTLANHTSGLDYEPSNINLSSDKNPKNPYQAYNYALFNDYLQNSLTINTTPGTTYQYSNLGFGLLGYLLEKVTDKEYESLFQDIVCNSYGLQNSTADYNKIKSLLVEGLDTLGKVIPHWDCNALVASGGILSNANDLSKFILSNFEDNSALELQRKITYSNMNSHTALGWEMLEIGGEKCTLNWYYKTGGMGGYSSAILMDTESQIGVVVLSNISAYHRNENTLQLSIELLKNLYIENIEKTNSCEAPFLEMALKNGWGTWTKSINDSILNIAGKENPLIGIWQKPSSSRSHYGNYYETRTFLPNGKVQTDFMGNPEIDVWGYYSTFGDRIEFEDIGGNACKNIGIYKYRIENDTLTFRLVNDNCAGRINGLSEKWIRKK